MPTVVPSQDLAIGIGIREVPPAEEKKLDQPGMTLVHEPVRIVEYDPAWPKKFADERVLLEDVFRGSTAIVEHVGSTAVPGLGAKPIIDILVGVADLSEVEVRISALEAIGYEYIPEYEKEFPERRYFRKPREGKREYHLHCMVRGSDFWNHHLAFRDYLREHPEAAAEYFRLKKELATRYERDRASYGEVKGPFISAILEKVKRGKQDV